MHKMILLLAIASSSTSLFAEKLYPTALPPRYYGFDQIRSPSCEAEAQSHAIEQVFANRGRKILISSWHRHLKNWKGKDLNTARIRPLTPSDQSIVDTSAEIIPDYMWPSNDHRTGWAGGWRPAVSQMSAIDLSFPNAGFVPEYQSFETDDAGNPYRNNGRDLNLIINELRAGNAVTVAIHSTILKLFDHTTGLMLKDKQYSHQLLMSETGMRNESFEKLPIDLYIEDAARTSQSTWEDEAADNVYSKGKDHAVAIVGYDSDFYRNEYPSNPGAFIVRNSWNDVWTVESVEDSASNRQKAAELERFRYPLYRSMAGASETPRNMAGYYAFPAQYFQDMINFSWPGSSKKGVGGFTVLRLNYDVFAKAYDQYASQYRTFRVPYTCGSAKVRAKNTIADYVDMLEWDSSGAANFLQIEAKGFPRPAFRVAYLTSRNGDLGLVRAFTNGSFDDYFCKDDPDASAFQPSWPGRYSVDTPAVWSTIEGISSLPNSVLSWSRYLRSMHDSGAAQW